MKLWCISIVLLFTPTLLYAQTNVLLIVADDMSWTDFGTYGMNTRQTPAIDRLARSGLLFDNLVIDSPRCRASLASLLSGQGLLTHGKFQNDTAGFVQYAGSLIDALNQAGYATRCEGKWWEGAPTTFGFDESGPRPNASGDPGFVRNGQDDALNFIRTNTETPWFLWYAPQLPHMPHDAPIEYLARFPANEIVVPSYYSGDAATYQTYQQAFLANQSRFNDAVGDILDVIADTGQSANTLVVFLSDNGYLIGEESKNSPHASGWRSPLIFRHPAIVASRNQSVVTTADIAPSILSFIGLPIPEEMTGRDVFTGTLVGSQFGAAFGNSPNGLQDDAFAIYGFDGRYSYRKWLKAVPPVYQMDEPFLTSVASYSAGQEQCFDLLNDPFEQTPVSINSTLRDATIVWWSGQTSPSPGSYSRTIDNSQVGYSETGAWNSNTNSGVGFLGDLRHSKIAGSTASWTFDDVTVGSVAVSASWVTHDNRSKAVPYTISDGTGVLLTLTKNQEGPHDRITKWFPLGTVEVVQPPLTVTVGIAEENTIADAVSVESQ